MHAYDLSRHALVWNTYVDEAEWVAVSPGKRRAILAAAKAMAEEEGPEDVGLQVRCSTFELRRQNWRKMME